MSIANGVSIIGRKRCSIISFHRLLKHDIQIGFRLRGADVWLQGPDQREEGSVLIELGNTRVICTATVDDGVPGFLKGQGKGWVTSEYGMLPRATEERTPREASRGKQTGRTLEIQRLIGRSLRAVTDQEAL